MTISNKIMGIGVAAVAFTALTLIWIVRDVSSESRVEEIHATMQSILMQSEEVADHMDKMHKAKAFDYAGLLERAKVQVGSRTLKEAYAETDLYLTIPVVAAWESVAQAAKNDGFDFVISTHPKIPARNPKNNRGDKYSEIFKGFDQGEKDYFNFDSDNKMVTYARPVKLSTSCLTCHGNPASSPSGNGKDVLGFDMENMKEGDIKGAFILQTPIRDDKKLASTMEFMIYAGLGTFVVVMILVWIVNRYTITAPLSRSIDQISGATKETAAASSEISSASHALASGSTEQASALEETSASLEELSSMTRRNADSAHASNEQTTATRQVSEQGAQDMAALSNAMSEVGDIVKSIDEIAFQTNILALNAAVEAARAGEAGMGFAVVADEVRSLARRSAEAARETGDKLSQGQRLTEKVAKSLNEIVTQIRKVDGLVSEIALASREQAQGIQQINEAVAQMDKVTQSNAASAEQTSSSATSLQTQSDLLRQSVDQLVAMVGRH